MTVMKYCTKSSADGRKFEKWFGEEMSLPLDRQHNREQGENGSAAYGCCGSHDSLSDLQ